MFTHKSDELIGKILGDYKIDRLIAKGGMGRVYEATDRQLNRRVAIKVITLDEDRATELMSRFRREALAISKLDNHPNIINIYRYGEQDGLHYLAMQLIHGQSLAERYQELKEKERFIQPDELLHIFRQIATALDHAHKHDVIHRDVKPANIMLEPPRDDPAGPRKAILMDFGLVMQADTTSTLGSAFGTPRYIAPEQAISSQQACPQSDIYSLGVIIYELLAGRPPFDEDETPMSIALSHITKAPPPLERFRPDLPQAVSEVVMRSMEKKPENRYQTATEFINDLAAAFEGFMPAPLPGQAPSKAKPIGRSIGTKPLGRAGMSNRLPWPLIGGVLFVALIFLVLLVLLLGGGDDGDTETDDNGDSDAIIDVDKTREAASNPTDAPTGEPATEVADNTTAPTDQSTTAPTEAPTQIITEAGEGLAGLALYYTSEYLTILNEGTATLDLGALELRRGDRTFTFADLPSKQLTPSGCTYVTTVATAAPENCPADQEAIPQLEYSDDQGFLWKDPRNNPNSTLTFDIYYNGELVTTCQVAAGACIIGGGG